MPDQPTDHRFQAEKWLEQARDIWNDMHPDVDPEVDRLDVTACALVGIGHALLAGLLEPIEHESIPVALTDLTMNDLSEAIRLKTAAIKAMTSDDQETNQPERETT